MDTLGDMLTRIRNGCLRKRLTVNVIRSQLCLRILDILFNEGYIGGYSVCEREVTVFLKYRGNASVIKNLKRISKLGLRRYMSYKRIMKVFCNNELVFCSTSRGIRVYSMSHGLDVKEKLGGEVMFILI